jgi:hypothetical protein
MAVTWIVQQNLGRTGDVPAIAEACARLGLGHLGVDAVPFSDDPPAAPAGGPTVFYGSTRFVRNALRAGRWWPAAFFDEARFRYSAWREPYREWLLNADAEVMPFERFAAAGHPPDRLFFIRPDGDDKEFAGEVLAFGEARAWYAQASAGGAAFDPACPIVVAEPAGIAEEWRLFVVDGAVSSGSQYRFRHRLSVAPGLPPEVAAFGAAVARRWSPAPAFALDLCRSGEGLYVLEVNCFNSAGFYASDVQKVVGDVSAFVARAARAPA